MLRPIPFAALCLLSALVMIAASDANADTLRLENGDTISGKVLAVNDQEVQIDSETFGKITLPRKKVIAIVFGNAKPAATATDDRKVPDAKIDPKASPEDLIKKFVPKDFDSKTVRELSKGAKAVPNPDDVIRQLRMQGVDPQLRRELELRLPGFAAPPVQAYFDKQVNGLISGEITLGDIRNDAVKVRDQLEDLKKDLGPSGAALDGYLGILNGFIKETKSVAPAKKKPEASSILPPAPPRPRHAPEKR